MEGSTAGGSPASPVTGVPSIAALLKSQYHATLAMLRQGIEACPDDLWYERRGRSAPWQIAYHALYFTHLYLQTHLEAFEPWEGHQAGVQHEDGFGGPTPDHVDADLPELPDPYTRTQVLAYWAYCDGQVDTWVDAMDLTSPDSGFFWYEVSKLEHQLINLRHLAHHTGQLADRVRVGADHGIRWIGGRQPR